MLREKIRSCSAVIHLAGEVYGAEPQQRDDDESRRSYTQLEYDIARELGKPVYVFVCGDGFPYDEHDPEDAEKQARQAEHRQALQTGDELYTNVASPDELVLKVGQLEERIQALTDQLQREQAAHESTQRHVGRWAAAITLLLLAIAAGIWLATQNQAEDEQTTRKQITDSQEQVQETIQEALIVDKARIREHLLEASDESYQRDLAKAETLTDWEKREEARQAAKDAQQRRASQIDLLVEEFETIESGGQANAVFTEMTRIIQEQGIEQALAYIASKQDNLLADFAASQEENRRTSLQPLLTAAKSANASGLTDEAEDLFEDIIQADPAWADARHALFELLVWTRGAHADDYDTTEQRLKIYQQAHQHALRLAQRDPDNTEWQRDLSISHNKVGDVLRTQGDNAKALEAYNAGMKIAQSLAQRDPDNTEWQRDLFVSEYKLGQIHSALKNEARSEIHFRQARNLLQSLTDQNKILPADRSILDYLNEHYGEP